MKLENLIIGLGKTGLSCLRYCLDKGWSVAVTDSRENPPGLEELNRIAPNAPAVFGELSADLIQHAERLIVSPGVSLKEPAIAKAIASGKPYAGDIELFAQAIKDGTPVIGITGSNAKSTVTSLVGEMAKTAGKNVQVVGNIGTPVLDNLNHKADLYILEVSSFQLETTNSLKTIAATILNVCEDHLDRYDSSMDDYIAAKQRVYQHAEMALYNRADPATLPQQQTKNLVSFGLDAPQDDNQYGLLLEGDQQFLAKGKEKILACNQLKLQGRHHLQNALAALALGDAAGLSRQAMCEILKTFSGLKHRCQLVAKIEDVEWYNDSKATNVGATVAALNGLDNDCHKNLILIAGGLGKDADFSPLREVISKHAKSLILIGRDAQRIAEICDDDIEIFHEASLADAVKSAKHIAKAGDKVLLSPACASFDMFDNFEARGDQFIQLVEK